MKRASRTFAIVVIAFYICMLPGTVLSMSYRYLAATKQWEKMRHIIYAKGGEVSIAIMNINCCLNPILYSNLHIKVESTVGTIWRRLKCGLGKLFTRSLISDDSTQMKVLEKRSSGHANCE